MHLYIVIPAYNESSSLLAVVNDLKKQGYHNIIIVNDGSTTLLDINGSYSNVWVIYHPVNLGQGAALQTGMNFAIQKEADIVVHFDADGQHSPLDIDQLLQPLLTEEADIVLGSRFMPGSRTNISFWRKTLIQAARYFNKILTGILLTDAHNGLRALNRKALFAINLKENRMAHATEIIAQIKKHKLRWREVPVSVLYTTYSKSKGQKSANAISILFDLILKKLKS